MRCVISTLFSRGGRDRTLVDVAIRDEANAEAQDHHGPGRGLRNTRCQGDRPGYVWVVRGSACHNVSVAMIAADNWTTFFELRKKLMDDWAAYATSDPAHTARVLPLRA